LFGRALKNKAKGPIDKNLVGGYATGYGLAIKFLFILACPIASAFACGLWLDRQLNTTPWLMLILVLVGLVFSIYAVYRVAIQLRDEMR
jgi:F0F1-type ATP synthase assembly protein I